MPSILVPTRRTVLKTGLAGAALAALPLGRASAASTVTMADIGVGDPGSWAGFTRYCW